MSNIILDCTNRAVPIRIWVSLEGLIPEKDIVIGNDGISELVVDITPNELITISRINGADISHNSRPLRDYAPMRMKPDRRLFYPNAYDPVKMVTYHDYKTKLTKAGIK